MQFHNLKRQTPNMKRMIVARGGKRGKTAGRGGKGQSARAGNKRRPEWRDIIKKLPKLRGRGVNQHKSIETKPAIVSLAVLGGMFSSGDSITPKILVEKGIISTWSGRVPSVKILGDGELTKILKIFGCTVSETARKEIEKAGGSIEAIKSTTLVKNPGHAGNPPKAAAPGASKKKAPVTAAPAPKEKKEVKVTAVKKSRPKTEKAIKQ